jgi:hypothetical protein
MLLDGPFRGGKAQACPAPLGRKERLEQSRANLRRNAGPGIGDRHVAVRRVGFDVDVDPAFAFHRLRGVQGEIEERAGESRGIGVDCRCLPGQPYGHVAHQRTPGGKVERRRQHRHQRDPSGAQGGWTSEVQHVVHHPGECVHAFDDLVKDGPLAAPVGQSRPDDLERSANAGERVAHLVGEDGRHPAEVGQAVLLDEPGVVAPMFGDVERDQDDLGDLPVGSLHGDERRGENARRSEVVCPELDEGRLPAECPGDRLLHAVRLMGASPGDEACADQVSVVVDSEHAHARPVDGSHSSVEIQLGDAHGRMVNERAVPRLVFTERVLERLFAR